MKTILNFAAILYGMTIGALLNAVSSLIPSAYDRAVKGLTKTSALLDKAHAAAVKRNTLELERRDRLYAEIDASYRTSNDASRDAGRALRVKRRLEELLA